MKQLLILLYIATLLIQPCWAQSKGYTATYEGVISTSELLKQFDSIDVVKDGVSDGKVPINAVPKMEMLLMRLSVHAQNERVVLTRIENANIQNHDGLNSPDSSVFEDGKWFTYRDGFKNAKPLFIDSVVGTTETKMIRGYACTKYIWYSKSTIESKELWVTKELPKCISPFALTLPVDGAIIESRQIGSNFTYRLVEVEHSKLDGVL